MARGSRPDVRTALAGRLQLPVAAPTPPRADAPLSDAEWRRLTQLLHDFWRDIAWDQLANQRLREVERYHRGSEMPYITAELNHQAEAVSRALGYPYGSWLDGARGPCARCGVIFRPRDAGVHAGGYTPAGPAHWHCMPAPDAQHEYGFVRAHLAPATASDPAHWLLDHLRAWAAGRRSLAEASSLAAAVNY